MASVVFGPAVSVTAAAVVLMVTAFVDMMGNLIVFPLIPFYAKRVRLFFDLKNPWVRVEESWDESGNQLEKIVIESVTRKTWNDQTFNPRNPEYKF